MQIQSQFFVIIILIVWWSQRWETDSNQALLTLSLRYLYLYPHMFTHIEWSLLIYAYPYWVLITYISSPILSALINIANCYIYSCLNFWDEACWFLSLRVFGLLSSPLLLFPQRFSRYVFRPSSGVCRTREPSWNFELRPLLNPRGSSVLIPLAIPGYKC